MKRVHADIDRLNVAVTEAIYLAVPSGQIIRHKYPAWLSGKLKVTLQRKIIFTDVIRSLRLTVSVTIFLYQIIVKELGEHSRYCDWLQAGRPIFLLSTSS
jgi:hypothetical protein